ATGTTGAVVTNSTAAKSVDLGAGTKVTGNVVVGPGANLTSAITLANNAQVTGSKSAEQAAMAIPQADAAPDLGASVGNQTINGVTTLSADLHCTDLDIGTSNILKISGNRTIVCDGNFTLGSSSRIDIQPSSSLRLYVHGLVTVKSSSEFNNNTKNAALVTIY